MERFALEAEKICEREDPEDGAWSRKHCVQAAMLLARYPPSVSSTALCRTDMGNACVAHFLNRNRHRYLYGSAYNSPRQRYELGAER